MADRVAYTGAPSTPGLRFEPTPEVHVDAPAAAFGVNVAQAVQGLGAVQEGAGKELFARALAFQDLTNHATARGASVKTAHEQAALWGEFDSKGGMDAGPAALDKLHSDLEAVRQKNSEGLNPTANELYQNDAASTQNRLYVYSATHSAQAVKKYDMDNINAETATRHAIVTGAAHIDPAAMAESWKKDEKNAIDLGHHNGEAPNSPAVKARIIENHNGTSIAAITGAIDRHDPDEAKRLRDIAVKNGKLNGEALDKADKMIVDSEERVGVAKTVKEIYDPKKSTEENIKAGVEASDKKTGGDVIAADRVTSRVMTQSAIEERIKKEKLDKANSAIDDVIHENLGKAPLSYDDLHNDPKLKEAFGVIESNEERRGQTELNIQARLRAAINGDTALTPERQALVHRLLGESQTNPSAFLKEDLWRLDLTADQRRELMKIKDGMSSGTSPEFRDRATEQTFGNYRKQIESSSGLGYAKGSAEYNELRGQFQEAINYAREHGKVVDPTMANKIMDKMLQNKVLSKSHFGSWFDTTGHEYQPSDEQKKMIKQLHPEYTDEEVNKFHARTIYDMLYNKDKASSDGK